MSREAILERVIALFSAMTEAEEISEDSEIIDDLEITSMDVLFIVSSLEAEFKVKIPEKDMRRMITVGDVADIIVDRA